MVAVAGDVSNEAEVVQAGTTITQSLTGSTAGFVLWDAERGLLAEAFFDRELEGSMTMPGMPSSLPANRRNLSIRGSRAGS